MSLQRADEDEQGQQAAVKKRRNAENAMEHWAVKRQRLKARKEEEELKRKRTVFVGNLPISCTKKVRRAGATFSGEPLHGFCNQTF